MKRFLSKLVFKLNGWRVVGVNKYPKKCLVISAPHTSNWDFFIGMCYAYIMRVEPKYLMKSEWFVPLLAPIIRWNGGVPVFRSKKNNVVDQVVKMFDDNSAFHFVITPEGTRTSVKRWKTGFYYIALKANLPILLLKMDYEKKEVGIICEFMPSGDFHKDMSYIQEQYKFVKGKIPEFYNPNII